MIDFLSGALSVLKERGNKIVQKLEAKNDVPPTVAEHCRDVAQRVRGNVKTLQKRENTLKSIQDSIKAKRITSSQSGKLVKNIVLSYRDIRRRIDIVEENFVGHIDRFNESDLFFTNLAGDLWKDTNLLGMPPIAVTNTSSYFCTWASLGIVFSPPSSEHHLLIFPDLYHEFGHILHEKFKIQLFSKRFHEELKNHITDLQNQIRRYSRPLDASTIASIYHRWTNGWAEEVACDTLATYMLGPAYGWCNLHLCLQSSDVFQGGYEHPADEARNNHIIRILRRQGFKDDADQIESLWKQYTNIVHKQTSPNYDENHPDSLFVAIMEDAEEIIKKEKFKARNNSEVIKVLDESWKVFLNKPNEYNSWEEATITKLKQNY